MAQKPSIPKGTRDFSPTEVARRNYIIQIIKKHFEVYGFQPIETPSFENSETLLGKYGDEGDRLIFKILNSGDFISKVDDVTYSSKKSNSLLPKISEKALRYDLTVPFARYVVMHQNEIDFPFKRYQIQPVWRADRPQKGRFREFYQCDADVVGSNSLLQEVELIQLYDAVFTELKLAGSTIKLNNRKILSGIAEVIGAKHLLIDFTVALDKLDKIGEEKVKEEMLDKGISEIAIEKASPLFAMNGDAAEQLAQLKSLLADSEVGMAGISELDEIIRTVKELGLKSASLQLDVTLARGLNYYTGAIFEVSAPEGVSMGSIGGGGRYDDLTGIFGLKDVSGIGISFGLDRIYLVLEELGLFPERLDKSIDVLCINFGEKESLASLKLVGKLRENGIKAEVYPSAAKMQKQMKYANNRKVPYVVLIGERELLNQEFVVKTMATGEQETYSLKNHGNFIDTL
ncbi:histidine--tRNA ligase [Flagellimonas eckloniae]|uniref:Histidine--tRNA ligase n=1 Tax=Flagellimonas eckloniae TaxID=346185 RepID=A0A0Q1CDP1_9FLAO|nr:histidine--tRNA ligase [Allomuricauda eckloniae]KQC28838.1 histidyl-tRNA synthase [Allomuricauda eckloniae]